MTLLDQDLAARVAAHLGATDLAAVRRASEIVLDGFAARLSSAERAILAGECSGQLGTRLERASVELAVPIDESLVALGLTAGQAREVIASVARVLAEALSDDALARVRRALPADLARFVVRPDPDVHAPRSTRWPDTLAGGRPGSHAPLSEAHPTLVQEASVVAANPHGDVKLASARGATQEREHETLAEGQPTSRTLADRRG